MALRSCRAPSLLWYVRRFWRRNSAQRRHFDQTIILLGVKWYITYKLSYRDLVVMMAEREADLTHPPILRWVQRYVPELEKRWQSPHQIHGGQPYGRFGCRREKIIFC